MQLTIPAKTFLLGEYIALTGGPVLIACTTPVFRCHITATNTALSQQYPIHPDSPAGKWVVAHAEDFKNYQINFQDPYHGAGGLGASTAQFLGCYIAWQRLCDPQWQFTPAHIPQLLQDYRQYAWNGQGYAPSGADLVAQTQQQLCYFEKNRQQLETYHWPFAQLSLLLIRTGTKIATHQHLNSLANIPSLPLADLVYAARAALVSQNSQAFIAAINDYAQYLEEHQLTLPSTLKILRLLRQHSACLAAKGCGALGADIIAALIPKLEQPQFCAWLYELGLQLVATNNELF